MQEVILNALTKEELMSLLTDLQWMSGETNESGWPLDRQERIELNQLYRAIQGRGNQSLINHYREWLDEMCRDDAAELRQLGYKLIY